MDDILNVVIFAVIFLLAAVFKGKKKPGGTGTRPAQHSAVRPQPRAAPSTRRGPALEQAAAGRAWGEPQGAMHEIVELLKAQYVEEGEETGGDGEGGEVTEAEAPSSPWSPRSSETRESLETLEAAGGASHERFHERYIDDTLSLPATVRARYSFHREPISMRQAIVWREILGPPKGLD